MVKMPKQNRFGLGVVLCVFNKDHSKILLVKRNLEKRKQWGATWGNVGGRIEFGEMSIQSAIREAEEEIGVRLKPPNIKFLEVREDPSLFPHLHGVHFIYATTINGNSKIKINNESDDYGWFAINKLPDDMLDKRRDILKWCAASKNNAKKRRARFL
jgi:8-oxo-dGTP pyrophosphatase MutT (NUDIX family)